MCFVGYDCTMNKDKYALVICMPTGMSCLKLQIVSWLWYTLQNWTAVANIA